MSALTEVKTNKTLESIIKDKLLAGENVSSSDLINAFNEQVEDNPLEEKTFDLNNNVVSYKETSSATKYNDTLNSIQKDIEDAYDTLLYISQQRAYSFERWKAELVKYSRMAARLKDSVNGLLAIKQDTAGYFNIITEDFNDLVNIDTTNTTAALDLDYHIATISYDSNSRQKIDLNNIQPEDMNFNILSRKKLKTYNLVPGSRLVHAVADQAYTWQHRVFMSASDEPVDAELRITVSNDDPIKVNRILVDLHSSNVSSNINTKILYSIDNYNWEDIPSVNNPQNIIDKGYFDFPDIEAKHFKFIMTKYGHDESTTSGYMYEFGAKEITFFTRAYNETESEVVSKPLSYLVDPENPLSAKKTFNQVSIEVCEVIPDATSIDYYVSLDDGTTWNNITPTNRDAAPFTRVVTAGGHVERSSNIDIILDLITSYSYKNANDILLENPDPLDVVDVTTLEIPHEHISVWRDIGQGDSVLTRESVSGWQFDEEYYTTFFNVENNDGIVIELGDTVAELDNEVITGTVSISKGAHKFRTYRGNWFMLPDGTDENSLQDNDILYPYNHKLLIEGFTYTGGFSGEKVYIGADLYASYIMTEINQFDFEYNIDDNDYSKYTIFETNEGGNDVLKFLIKYNNNISDFANENFYISSRTVQNNVDEVLVKSVLQTQTLDVSPILTGYKVKIGN